MKEDLSHKQEKRNGHEGKLRQRPPTIVQKRNHAALTAHEHPSAENVRGEKCQCHGHAERHQQHYAADQERKGFEPFHYSWIPASPECISSLPKTKRANSMAMKLNAMGNVIVSNQRG